MKSVCGYLIVFESVRFNIYCRKSRTKSVNEIPKSRMGILILNIMGSEHNS